MQVVECFESIWRCMQYYICGKKIKICIAGPAGSGKTSFCKAFLNQRILKKERATPGVQSRKFVRNGIQGIFYDIGGSITYQNQINFTYRTSQAFFFVVDASDPTTFSAAKTMLSDIVYRNRAINSPILVLCTHNDIEGYKSSQDIALDIGLDSFLGRDISCYSISSLTLSNFAAVEEWITKHA